MVNFKRRALLSGGAAISTSAMSTAWAKEKSMDTSAERTTAESKALIDPTQVQMLFADLQPSLTIGCSTVSSSDLGQSAGILCKVAHLLAIPTTFSVVPEEDGAPKLIKELTDYATAENTLVRKLTGPFTDRRTVARLKSGKRSTLIVSGFAAEVVILQGIVDGLKAGFTVFYVVDAIGSHSARTEAAAFREIERYGAIPTSVLSLATRLAPDFSQSPGKEVFAALQPLIT